MKFLKTILPICLVCLVLFGCNQKNDSMTDLQLGVEGESEQKSEENSYSEIIDFEPPSFAKWGADIVDIMQAETKSLFRNGTDDGDGTRILIYDPENKAFSNGKYECTYKIAYHFRNEKLWAYMVQFDDKEWDESTDFEVYTLVKTFVDPTLMSDEWKDNSDQCTIGSEMGADVSAGWESEDTQLDLIWGKKSGRLILYSKK